MTDRFEISQADLNLILSALDDAMFYRDARSHAGGNVVRHEDRAKAEAYAALVRKLKPFRRSQDLVK